MNIDIQARHFSLTEALRDHAERRLRFALTCCNDHIQKIVMRLSDINGPRGGSDKHCHLQLVVAGMPDIVIEDTEVNLYVAINRAVERAARALLRKVERQNRLKKHRRPLKLMNEEPLENDTAQPQYREF